MFLFCALLRVTHESFRASNREKPHALRKRELGRNLISKMAAIFYSRLCIRNSGRLGQNLPFFECKYTRVFVIDSLFSYQQRVHLHGLLLLPRLFLAHREFKVVSYTILSGVWMLRMRSLLILFVWYFCFLVVFKKTVHSSANRKAELGK